MLHMPSSYFWRFIYRSLCPRFARRPVWTHHCAQDSTGARELADLSARLFAARLSALKSDPLEGSSSVEIAKVEIARLAFQVGTVQRIGRGHSCGHASLYIRR